jgi:hypothetical protein
MRVALLERNVPLSEHYRAAIDEFFSEVEPFIAA